MRSEERDILLVRYLDGTATAGEVGVLNELLKVDPEARASLSEMTMQALAMGDLARERTLTGERRKTAPVAGRRWLRPMLAAAAVLLAGIGLWAWLLRMPAERVVLVQASGAVSWSTEAGQSRSGLAAGVVLGAGTVNVEGAASSAQLRFADGSTVLLAGGSELAFAGGRQKRLMLRRGSIMAEVRPQPDGRPLLVRTATAEAQVLGTRFSLSVQEGQTSLAVETGKVRLARLVDGQMVDVVAGGVASATLDATVKLRSWPLPPAPARWRQTFDQQPPAQWQGEWLAPQGAEPGRMRNVLDVSERREDGTVVVGYTVNVRDNSGSIASIRPDSVLRLRWRTGVKQDVMALVGLHQSTGGFAGNFQTLIKPGMGSVDAGGWRTIELPVSGLEPRIPNCPRPPAGARVFLVYIACYSPSANLEVAEVAVESPLAQQP